MPARSFTRRDLIEFGGGAIAAAGMAGLAAGRSDRVRVNVGFDAPAGERAARAAAAEVVHEFAFDALTILAAPDEARALENTPGVTYVERDRRVEAIRRLSSGGGSGPSGAGASAGSEGTTDATADASASAAGASGAESEADDGDSSTGGAASSGESSGQVLPWGIDRVDAEVAHDGGDTGSGADVAVIDTGIDMTHLDLRATVGGGALVIGASITDTVVPGGQDNNGHGTHVAGIAGAVDDSKGVVGVAPDVTLHPVKALTAAGVGFVSDVAKGIEYTADQGWDVANLSLGGPETDTLEEACKYAHRRGVLLVAAAGNSGPCEDCVTYPAAYNTVVAVSATTRDDDLAEFSSTGPEVELAAPGQNILSTYLGNTYVSMNGTSMACPHVAGAGAQLMANGYDNDDARRQLRSTAEDIGLSGREQGHGLVDVAAALGYDSSDDLDGGVNGGSAPSASIDGVTESESPDPHAVFEVSWSAGDDDGDLASAELALIDDTDGGREDSESVDISGSSASDTTTLRARHDDGSENEYLVSLYVRDEAGNAGSGSETVTESDE